MYNTSGDRIDWNELSHSWPDLIYLRKVEKLPNFPWSATYFRKLCCGRNADLKLKSAVFHIGHFAAIKKSDLVDYMQGFGGAQ